MNDEFEITATAVNQEPRVWTRDKLESAKVIADKAVSNLGYESAIVVNTFGGIKSNPLYIATVNSVKQLKCLGCPNVAATGNNYCASCQVLRKRRLPVGYR